MVPDPYKTLNVPHTATMEQIKRSYRELARQYHPDRIATVEQKDDATTKFAAIASAYALLTDPQRKAQYDHIYRYGGYDDDGDDDGIAAKYERHAGSSAPSSQSVPQTNPATDRSRKRKTSSAAATASVGYACVDPLAFLWTNGKVQTKIAVAGIQIPSRLELAQNNTGLRFAFSSGQVSRSPSGTRTITRQTTHFAHGKKYTRTETTILHPDGRKEVLLESDGDVCERRWYAAPAGASAAGGAEAEHVTHTEKSPTEPWYAHAWHGIREKLTMCYNPCAVVAAQ